MLLSAKTLRVVKPVRPFCERGVIRGRSFGVSVAGYDIRIAEGHRLLAGQFALGSSLEEFDIPKNLVALVKDKSSWARLGLSVFNTVAEAGWKGYLTLELKNQSDKTIVIRSGDPIAQVLFFTTDETTDGYTGKYQNQSPGPQKALYE